MPKLEKSCHLLCVLLSLWRFKTKHPNLLRAQTERVQTRENARTDGCTRARLSIAV